MDPCIVTQLINKTTNLMQLGAIVIILTERIWRHADSKYY